MINSGIIDQGKHTEISVMENIAYDLDRIKGRIKQFYSFKNEC